MNVVLQNYYCLSLFYSQKKKTIMNQKYLIFFIGLIVLSFSSCVSKKKYLEMEAGRLKAEELSRQLDAENKAKAERIKALIADYEAMKNELLESNAIKDDFIDSLKNEMFVLSQELNKQTESLEETSFNLDFEKQRLSNALNTKDKTIGSLQNEVEKLNQELAGKNSTIEEKNFDIRRLDEQSKVLEDQIEAGETKFTELQQRLEKSKSETQEILKEMEKKDAEISKLNNQVKLLKSEIGG